MPPAAPPANPRDAMAPTRLLPEDDREFHFTDDDFRYVSKLVYDRARIVLKAEKRNLVYSRLARRLRALKLRAFKDYIDFVERDESGDELVHLLNAITTNLTSFFRESHHFEHLKATALPDILNARRKAGTSRVRLWSAGCSSGPEPYSIAMTVLDHLAGKTTGWDLKILATDIDTNMVRRAEEGDYEPKMADGIPPDAARKYCEAGYRGHVRMGDALRRLITFKTLNLMDEPWPMKGRFDVIFCRNVVIYFDKPTQRHLFDRFADIIADDGWLYVGHSESLFSVTDRFVLSGPTCYRKVR